MSNKLVRAVRDNRSVKNPYDRFILFLLSDHANDTNGLCCPSLLTLADESGMDKRSVMRCLGRLEQEGIIRRDKGGGERHPTKYFFPGLQNPDRDHMPLSNGDQDRDHMPLSIDTHGNRNGAVESAQTGTVGHPDRDRGASRQGPWCVKTGTVCPPKQKEAEGLNQKKPSAASTTAKEPSASAVAADEPFAPTSDQNSHGIHEKWIESLKSKYPKANGDYVESKCRKWCEERRKPFTPEIFEKFLSTEHLPKPKQDKSTQTSETKKQSKKSDKVSAPKMIDVNILYDAVNECILGNIPLREYETKEQLFKYLKAKIRGIDPIALIATAKNSPSLWRSCGFDHKGYLNEE
jgi:Helix-turn-helix domain